LARIKRLDHYVAATFLGPFVLCLVGFVGLYVVIDFFSNIDEFITHDSFLDTARLTAAYYVVRIPSYLAQIMPILTVLPAVVCMIRLQRSNELCAIRSSGVSVRRTIVPLLLCGTVVMILSAMNQELLVPALHRPLLDAERRARKAKKKLIGLSHAVDKKGRLLLIGEFDYDVPLPTLTDVRITRHESRDGRPTEIRAARAFSPDTEGDRTQWYMEGAQSYARDADTVRSVKPTRFTSPATARLIEDYSAGRTRVLQASDSGGTNGTLSHYEFGSYTEQVQRWPVARHVEIIDPAKPEEGRLGVAMMVWIEDRWLMFGATQFLGIDPDIRREVPLVLAPGTELGGGLKPSDIQAGEFKRASAMMTLAELAELGSRFPSRRFRQRCWVIIWNRIAFPLANVVLVLLALPLVFRQTAHAALLGVALAALMTLLYLVANFVSIDLAYRQWPVWQWPLFAGTFPTILFGAAAVSLFARMDRV